MPTERTTPPPFVMTPLFLDGLHEYSLGETMRYLDEENGELSPAEKEGVKAALQEEHRRNVVGDMVEPPVMEDSIIRRVFNIKVLMHQSLDIGKDFEEVLSGYRSLLEQEAVEFRLKWLWPPVKDKDGNVSVSPPPRTQDEKSSSPMSPVERIIDECAGRGLDAYRYLFLHHPQLLDEAMKVRERDSSIAMLAVIHVYEKVQRRRGRRRSGPQPFVATRVFTIEALRELCNLSQADARRLWNHWFRRQPKRCLDESGGQYGDDLKIVVALTRRHMALDTVNRRLTEREIQEMVDEWRANERN